MKLNSKRISEYFKKIVDMSVPFGGIYQLAHFGSVVPDFGDKRDENGEEVTLQPREVLRVGGVFLDTHTEIAGGRGGRRSAVPVTYFL